MIKRAALGVLGMLAGAMGLKVFKDLGMFGRKPDGSRLRVDDPELDPIANERWLELALVPDRRHQTGVRFEALVTERNNMIREHPRTTYILPHFGWHANDLARAGRLLDEKLLRRLPYAGSTD
jgi:hypothetical protein